MTNLQSLVFFEFNSQSLCPMFLMIVFTYCIFLALLIFYIWKPTFNHLIFNYNLLMKKSHNNIKILWFSIFYWFFLAPCAMLTNDRLHPLVWFLNFMFIKNVAYHAESFALDLLVLLHITLLFEHLLFVFVWYSSKTVRNFFINIFGTRLIFFCLGNMWKGPAKKLAVFAGAGGYDVTISVLSEQAATTVADQSLTQFPDQTLQDYTHTRNQVADKYYNRYSVCGNFSTFMSNFFCK